MNDREFEAAYRALIEQDAQFRAPDGLRVNVMARWDGERARLTGKRSVSTSVRSLAAAAVVLIVAGAVGHFRRLEPAQSGTVPAQTVDWTLATRAVSNPFVRLVPDPRFETESLQIVRLRLPGSSLEPFGIELAGSDQSGLVEVDMLVGDDGLPREIRSIEEVVVRDVQ